jgi:hypothetical protein
MKHQVRRLARAALAGLLVFATAASATEPCLQPREAEDLVTFVLPALTDAAARKCGPLLPPDATLTRSGPALVARYRPDSVTAWSNAKVAFGKISGGETLGFLSDEVNRKVIEEATSAAIVADLKAKDCAMIDRFAGALAPLPARNVARLVALLMEVGEKGGKSPMNICPAEGTR